MKTPTEYTYLCTSCRVITTDEIPRVSYECPHCGAEGLIAYDDEPEDLSDIATDKLISELAQFEDRIVVLKGIDEDYLDEAELVGCEGAAMSIEEVLEGRGIKPIQALAEYRAGTVAST